MVSWASLASSPLFTPSLTVVPGLYFWTSAASSTRSATGFPLTDTMVSPTLSPALAAGLRAQVARRAVADRVDLVVVDAVDAVHLLGDLVDPIEGRDREDVALLHLDHQLDVVGAAEGPGVLVVDLDERVALREEVAEARLELQLGAQVGEVPEDDHAGA